jgi:mersacidin/lichenicidin family type 2 lantibiotic
MMNGPDIIRAWKDEAYRMSLTDAERAALPDNPAGLIELHRAELQTAAGGVKPMARRTMPSDCVTAGPLCPRHSNGMGFCPVTHNPFCPTPSTLFCPTTYSCPIDRAR